LNLEIDKKQVFASTAGKDFDPAKQTVFLLHGSGLSHIVWSLTEQFLSNKGLNILSLDLPGHGNSEGPCIDSIEKIADWIERVRLFLNIEALEYGSRFKKSIFKLVFLAGSYKMPVNQDLIDLADSGDKKAIHLMMKWGYEGSRKFIGGNPVEKIINSSREVKEILATDLKACNNYKNGKEASAAIECPTLLIFGALDKMVPYENGKKFANLIKNSKTQIINECGHMIMFEKAFEMREKVAEFLKK
jgi:pimeloyl-ACP methyl ester carboxylesterase